MFKMVVLTLQYLNNSTYFIKSRKCTALYDTHAKPKREKIYFNSIELLNFMQWCTGERPCVTLVVFKCHFSAFCKNLWLVASFTFIMENLYTYEEIMSI